MNEFSEAERVGIPDEARWKGMATPSDYNPSNMNAYKEKPPAANF
jgi:hypothetical protein